METNVLGTKFVTQIGILVHDIEKTAQAFADFLGVEKPRACLLRDTPDKAQTEFRGRSSEARAKLAFFNLGSLQLELIEPDHNASTCESRSTRMEKIRITLLLSWRV